MSQELGRIANALDRLCDLLGEEEPEPPRCRLLITDGADASVTDAVNKLMNATAHWTRAEYEALVSGVFNDGIRAVVHERG